MVKPATSTTMRTICALVHDDAVQYSARARRRGWGGTSTGSEPLRRLTNASMNFIGPGRNSAIRAMMSSNRLGCISTKQPTHARTVDLKDAKRFRPRPKARRRRDRRVVLRPPETEVRVVSSILGTARCNTVSVMRPRKSIFSSPSLSRESWRIGSPPPPPLGNAIEGDVGRQGVGRDNNAGGVGRGVAGHSLSSRDMSTSLRMMGSSSYKA